MTKLFTCLTIILAFNTLGLENEKIGERAQRLVTYFAHNHLQPREMDDQFGLDLHLELLDYLDDEHLVFMQSDVDQLAAMASELDDQVRTAKTDYLQEAERIFRERLSECKMFWQALGRKGKSVLAVKGTLKEDETFAKDQMELQMRWTQYFNKSIQLELLDISESDETLDLEKLTEKEKSVRDDVLLELKNSIDQRLKTENYFEVMYLNAITHCYDPHSSYFNTQMKEEFSEELSSEREIFGIGTGAKMNGEIEITEVAPGSSAWFSGEVHEGDIITTVSTPGGKSLDVTKADLKAFSDFVDAIEGDTLLLELKNIEGKNTVELVRGLVYSDEDVIKSAILESDQSIGYISLPDFYTNWTDTSALGCANDIAKSLLKMNREGIDGLILDLRGNGGGSLKEAIDLVGIFINYGPVNIEEDYEHVVFTYKDFNRGSIYRGPLIVMIDSESASASEIVAGSLQDHNRALIVGNTSFGKATGQVVLPLDPALDDTYGIEEDPSWGYVKITDIGLYRLDKGSAQQVGVNPDIELELESLYEPEYEKELRHSIQLDSVVKKVYFTPKSPLPISELKTAYANNKLESLDQLNTKLDSIVTVAVQSYESLSLSESFQLDKVGSRLIDEYKAMVKEVDFEYVPKSLQFKENLLKLSPYLKKYNDRFLEGLSKDLGLNEAVKIMENYIQLSAK